MLMYLVELYCGKTYCGNGVFATLKECYKFAQDDGFCDKAIITDLITEEKKTVRIVRNNF